MKRTKRAAAMIITAAVITGTVPATGVIMPAYAAQEQAQQMESVIQTVKTKIDVPTEFSVFESDAMQNQDKTFYGLRWSTPDNEKGIYIECDAQGNLTGYSSYGSQESQSTLNISRDEALQAAETFLKKAAPERFSDENDHLVLVNDIKSGDLNRYYFSYIRKHGDVEVLNNSASVSVMVNDGKPVINHVNINWTDGEFTGEANMTLEDAKTAYAEMFPIELSYHATYGKDKKYIMSYSFKDTDRFLNAETGEKAQLFRENGLVNAGGGASPSMKEEAADTDSGAALTPEEQAEVKNYEDMEAVEAIKNKIFAVSELNIDKSSEITDTYVSKDKENDIYYLRVSCKDKEDQYFSFTTDAKTGELYHFYKGRIYHGVNPLADREKELTDAEKTVFQAKAESFMKAQNPDKFPQVRFENSTSYQGQANYTYVRLVNGIPFQNDTINASWDTQTDGIQSYSVNWSKLPDTLPDPAKAISATDAINALYEKYPLTYEYILTEKGKYSLCVAMDNAAWQNVDGLTGKIIKYDGSEVSEDYAPVEYTDLDGHWAKNAAQALASVGIGLPGSEFRADETITQADLLYLLLCVRGQYVYNEISYDDIYSRGKNIIPESEQNPQGTVTREKAVTYMLVNGEYDKAAKIPGIFKTGFADEDQISPDCLGYVAIAKGLGMISGTGDGFDPQGNITRGQAAVMLYQYLMK